MAPWASSAAQLAVRRALRLSRRDRFGNSLLGGGLGDGLADEDGAVFAGQIFLGNGLDFGGGDGGQFAENGVDAMRVVVEKREACESVHQAEAGHTAVAGFEHGIKIG